MTNTRKDVRNNFSEFDGLFRKMVSKVPFINQEKGFINKKGKMNCYTFTNYITVTFNVVEIYRNCARYEKNRKYQ